MGNMRYRQVRVMSGQTLADVAVQEYGHMDGVWLLLEDNPGLVADLGEVPAPGTVVNVRVDVPELGPGSRETAEALKRYGQKVATGAVWTEKPWDGYVAEGYWAEGYGV